MGLFRKRPDPVQSVVGLVAAIAGGNDGEAARLAPLVEKLNALEIMSTLLRVFGPIAADVDQDGRTAINAQLDNTDASPEMKAALRSVGEKIFIRGDQQGMAAAAGRSAVPLISAKESIPALSLELIFAAARVCQTLDIKFS